MTVLIWRPTTAPSMTRNATVRQRDLLEADEHQTAPIPVQREQVARLIEALLREIATALTSGEVDDDQDHG
jgi:hypothetical protein